MPIGNGLIVKFGRYPENYKWSVTTGGTSRAVATRTRIQPWLLRHISSIKIQCSNTNTKIGLPGYHASDAQIFDMTGPVMQLTISGVRYDNEEEISNWDFINTKDNIVTEGNVDTTYTGLSYLLAEVQAVSEGYYLYISEDNSSSTINNRTFISGTYNVALSDISATISPDAPWTMDYSITVILRRGLIQ